MNRGDDWLRRHCVPREAGASFKATREGGLALIEPLTTEAENWLHAQTDEEASWNGPALVVEMRYFPALADAIIDAGYLFERDAYLN